MTAALATKTRRDFQRLADLRASEAISLGRSRNHQGAYYLAGYAIECALKACIAKKTRRHDYPEKQFVLDSYTHNLEKLVVLAGLKLLLDAELDLRLPWITVKDWTEESRYDRTITRA